MTFRIDPSMDTHDTNIVLSSPQRPFGGIFEPPCIRPADSVDQLLPMPDESYPDGPSRTPHRQEVRFLADLYTPIFVRGVGKMREGWCGICQPGRWLLLKNSAFWYDKVFVHGICAATGTTFDSPKDFRPILGHCGWEGLCGTCEYWVALVGTKKKGTTWFRHAYEVCTGLFISIIL